MKEPLEASVIRGQIFQQQKKMRKKDEKPYFQLTSLIRSIEENKIKIAAG